ncbi:MAG: response regulator [Myxococcales bacterium]|nr:response regulator [Myxococcales bacterium]
MKRVSPDMRTWQIVNPLTWALIGGAVLAIAAILLGQLAVFATIISLVCLAGAYHIKLIVNTSHKSLGVLVETSLSQRQVGDVLDSLGDAVMLVDSLGAIRMANRKLCELSNYPASALIGKPIAQALGIELPRSNILTSTTFDLPFLAEQELRRRGGGTVAVSIGLVAAQGNVVCVIKDIREERLRQRQLDDAVQIAEQVLHTHNDFMTLLALELKDPLASLRSGCRAALEAPAGSDLRPMVQSVADHQSELERVILDLFALGRTGGSADDARMLYPSTLVREVVEALASNAARMGTEVRHWVDPETPTQFYGRDIQIRQILALLGNFALGRSAGGEVRIAVGPVPGDNDASQLLFSVRDTGPALSDSVMNLELTPRTERSAAQFDLAIARLLVLSLGGKMTASNTAGRTATIYFTVPGVPATAVPQPDTRQSSSRFRRVELDASLRLARLALPESETTSPEHGVVLVVDANEATRNLLAHQIQRAGYTVKTAGTGKAALDLAWQEKLDVILLDVMLPDRDGIAVLEALQKQGTLDQVSVLMTSAVDEKTSIAACIERGAEDFLPKPIHPAILRARLGTCIEKKQLRDRTKQHLEQLAAEGRRSNELLRVLFPDAIADELQATGTIAPRRHEMVAVMFADLVGFTEYCDQHSPEEVLVILQELFTRFEALASDFNVQKIKTIGDSFMGAAGLFVPDPRPALRCVAYGEAMLAAVRETTTRWALRIGIHVGPVVGGVVGNQRYLYDIWGDTVNTAQRIEHGGKTGTICVSAAARAQIEPNYRTRSLGVTGLKGKGGLELFEVMRPDADE